MARRPGPPREQISAGLRFDILRRCNFACYYCGIPAALGLKVLHIDHVVPVKLGGTNDPWNLVAACWDCNLGKSALPPTRALIDAIRADHCAHVDERDGRIEQCAYCRLPVHVAEGDDFYDQCETRNANLCTANELGWQGGWENGYQRGVDDMAGHVVAYMKKGGGPDVVQG